MGYFYGDDSNNYITSNQYNNYIWGYAGHDTLLGLDGNDTILNHASSEYQLSLSPEFDSKYIKEAAIAFENQRNLSLPSNLDLLNDNFFIDPDNSLNNAKGIILGENPSIYVDPANSLDDAKEITLGENPAIYNDWVGETDTNDYYRFSLTESSNFELTLKNGTWLTSNADVELLDSTGNLFLRSINPTQIDESINAQLLPGTYYIRVYPHYNWNNTDYNLTVSATAVNDAGNTLNDAKEITLEENPVTYNDWVGETDTNDYYRFSLAESSNFDLTLLTTGTGLASNADVELLDSAGTQLMRSSNASQIDESIKAQLLPGTYYIRVYPDHSWTNTDYNLTVSATPVNDAGNRLNDATEIILEENPVTYIDWVGATDEHDYYRFSLAESNNFELTLTGLASNADVRLLDSTGTQLMRSSYAGRTDESIKAQLLAGTYYIGVEPHYSWHNTDYNLTVFATPVNDAGNRLNDATEIILRENPVTYNDWVGATDEHDYYRFSLAESNNFELTLTGLASNADVRLLDSTGTQLMRSSYAGRTDESIKAQLLAGTYYIGVEPHYSWHNTDYTLTVSTPANLVENPPAPSDNSAPWNFIFATDRLIYEPGERVSLKSGFVYDIPSWNDVERIDWWISKDGGEYRDIEDTVEFWPGDGHDFNRNNTAYFDLPDEWNQDLDEGEYTLRGQAVDKSGLVSNKWSWNFIVQETNYAPTDLSIFTEGVYPLATDETFSVKGEVYDENGADDLKKLKVYIEKQGDATWTPLDDYFDVFSPNNGDPNWANFEIPLAGIGTGSYKVSVFAYDKSGASSGIAQSNFTVQNIHDERFNFEYGYGLVNAAKAVAMAIGEEYPFPDVDDVTIASWEINKVKSPEAWARGFTGKGVTVAVIDTGIDIEHDELADSIWINPGEIPDDGIDNDNNGYVDDIHGWNFGIGQNNNDVTPGSGNPLSNGHGTHVAGIIAANYTGLTDLVAGVAPDVKIMSLRMGDVKRNTFANPGDLSEAIRYAVDNGADVINMSLSWEPGDLGFEKLENALAYAASKNVITVSAAGNFKYWKPFVPEPVKPARFATDYGISVGALRSDYELTTYTHGAGFDSRMLHVMAPGGDRDQMIFSTIPGNNYGPNAGTSIAAPHVAGVVALMLSANPNLTHDEVRQILIDSATALPLGNQNSRSFVASSNLASGDNNIYVGHAVASDNIHLGINEVEDFNLGDQPLHLTPQILRQEQAGIREYENELFSVFKEDSTPTKLESSKANELEDAPADAVSPDKITGLAYLAQHLGSSPSVRDPLLAPGRVGLDWLEKDDLLNARLFYGQEGLQ